MIKKIIILYRFFRKTKEQLNREVEDLRRKIVNLENSVVELKRVEKALHDSESRYRSFFEASPDGIVILDPETTQPIEFNDQACRQLGYTREEFAQLYLSDIEAKETAEQARKHIRKVIDQRHDDFETQHFTKQGNIKDVRVIAQTIRTSKGQVYHCIWRDITDRKMAADSLRDSEAKFRALAENAPEAIYIIQGNKFLYVNPATEVITGYNSVELLKMNFWEVVHPDFRDPVRERNLARQRGEPVPKRYEFKILTKTGSVLWLEFFGGVFELEGKPAIMGLCFDTTQRKQVEEEKERLRVQLANAVNMARLGPWEYDVASDLFMFNDHFYRIFGTTAKQAGGHTMSSAEYARRFIHPDEMAVMAEEIRKAIETTDPNYSRRLEHRVLYADGTVVHISVWFSIVKNADGQTIKGYGVMQDITDQKQAEKALKASEKKYRELYDFLPIPVYEMDFEGNITSGNRVVCETFRCTKEDLNKGMKIWQFLSPEGVQRATKNIQRLLQGEQITGTEYDLMRLDGSFFPAIVIFSLIISDGKPIGLRGAIVDITQQRQQEKKMSWTNAFLDSIVENIPDMIFLKDAKELRFVQLNRAGEDLLGYSRQEMLGKNDYDFFPKEQADFFTGKDREALRKKEVVDIPEEILQSHNKGERTLHTKKVPILDVKGEPEYLLGISEDITERKRAEDEKARLQAQLFQAQRMEAIGTLAGGIAHDFNNILTIIIGCSELILMNLSIEDPHREYLAQVYQAGKRAADLVQQILTFSRHTEQKRKLLQPAVIVKEALKMLKSSLPATIDIQQDIQRDPGAILADPTHFHQILMNLCINAAHAMREKIGILKITLEKVQVEVDEIDQYEGLMPGPYIRLMVSDTGHGMEAEVLEKIFDPYFTTKALGEGTGLGLAVVYGIVKSYQGGIKVSSEPGKGSTFEIFLPRIDHSHESLIINESESLPGGKEKILMVDDEEIVVYTVQRVLENLGYPVTSLTSSLKALETFQAKANKFDVVITDMTMPYLDGIGLSQSIKKIRSDIPIIICTGYSERIDEERVKSLGLQALLRKPIAIKVLAETIRRVLDQKNAG